MTHVTQKKYQYGDYECLTFLEEMLDIHNPHTSIVLGAHEARLSSDPPLACEQAVSHQSATMID